MYLAENHRLCTARLRPHKIIKFKRAVGVASNFQLFSLPSSVAVSNFYSFLSLNSKGGVDMPMQVGSSLQHHLYRVIGKEKLKKLVPVDLENIDVACTYPPPSPSVWSRRIFPGGCPESLDTVEAISALHPFAKVWVEAIVESKFLLSSQAHPSIIVEIMPNMGHGMPTKCSPETDLKLVRKDPIKATFDD